MERNQKPYSFMKEVIKKEQRDKKQVALRLAVLGACAVAFGFIAAFTFAAVLPIAREAVGESTKTERVDIPKDLEPTPAPSSEETDSLEGTDTGENEISMEEYKNLYKQMQAVAEEPKKSLVTVNGIRSTEDWFNQTYENFSQSTGVIVTENTFYYFILTEYKNIDGVQEIQVIFQDGYSVRGEYQKHDTNTDLAIIKVAKKDIEPETLAQIKVAPLGNSYSISQGEPIIALGSPSGTSNSVAVGTVTSVDNKVMTVDHEYNILTTNIIGSKEGSGVLLNLDGEVVGIIAQSYGAKDQNIIIGLAISQLKELIEKLSNNEMRPYIGLKGQNVTKEISKMSGIPEGIRVTQVVGDSPAMLAGIKETDVITKIGDQSVLTFKQYENELHKCKTGDVMKITGLREGADGYVEITFDVTVGAL